MFLLDTNAVSEPRKPAPDAAFMAWLGERDASELWISALSVGELRYGVLRMEAGAKRRALEQWLAEASVLFQDRILPVDKVVSERWAELTLANERSGLTRGMVDELIAATAVARGLTVVTRNLRHFDGGDCQAISPWAT